MYEKNNFFSTIRLTWLKFLIYFDGNTLSAQQYWLLCMLTDGTKSLIAFDIRTLK